MNDKNKSDEPDIIHLEIIKSGDYPGHVYIRVVAPTLNPKRFSRIIPSKFLRSDGEIVLKLISPLNSPSTYYESEEAAVEKIKEFYEAQKV